MSLKPCWKIKNCGREKGGANEAALGTCPAYPDSGHSCWMVTGTLCGGIVQGTFAQKEMNCLQCNVYRLYNLRSGTERIQVVTDCKAELGQYFDGASTWTDGQTPEGMLEVLRESIGKTLEERVQVRTRELLEANENLRREIAERRRLEEQIKHMAYHDFLTDLPNRVIFESRLAEEISRAQRGLLNLAVLHVDLDRFKTINDTLGHSMGDQLLKAVASRLKENLRQYDIVSRLDGDEFVVVLSEVQSPQDVNRLARRILDHLKILFQIGGHKLYITLSMGIAVYPADGQDPQALMKNADCAMSRAKELGRNNYQFYEPEMNKRAARQAKLETAMAEAVERNEFVLEYQPQVDLKTNAVVGMEALVRWLHPDMGLIPPGDFIPLAEETGLIIPIGEWVLREACQQNKAWQEVGYAPMRVAVNLSARQFRQQILGRLVAKVLRETGLEPKWLDLEITESEIMMDTANTISQLRNLSEKGVNVSLDDFGTGYSSLNYLKCLPVNTVKIDRTFVENLSMSADDVAIAKAIIVMAHRLKLRVVAEGVETKGQLDLLRRLKCDSMQGFYYSRPLAPEKAVELLPRRKVSARSGRAQAKVSREANRYFDSASISASRRGPEDR